ncbi:MAG: NAD-dependent succinate-semialdehyde dehydrogenase [Gammaproteobacteria bacterium]|nr:NAD-dependent succinate-semialdehyde dehydrogenase [Gammaproteobacteria bacterium]
MSISLANPELLLQEGWIDGRPASGERRFDILNPATLESVATVSDLGAGDAGRAIAAAAEAFTTWKTLSMQERSSLIADWATLIDDNSADLARILSSENGKPLSEASGEIGQCASLLRWYAQEALRLTGATLPWQSAGQRNFTIKQPIGVAACITPWNFPAAAVIVKAGAAIVTGCTCVAKPSEETPLIALALARLSKMAGVPDGVFNVVPCRNPAAVGDAICASPDVRMLSFTGSTKVGKQLYSACGETLKRITLELGGNAPFVVFDDADLDTAVACAVNARFYNGGQICVGANRFFVHDAIYDAFADRLAGKVSQLTIGNGLDPSTQIGPMINRAAIGRLERLIDDSMSKGATILNGGTRRDDESLFFLPTVLSNMQPTMAAYTTEIFGPVACLYRFEREDDVLQKANDTQAGLAAYVFSGNPRRLLRFSEALEAGVIGANSTNIFSNDLPFGGIKQSGLGREHGLHCLDEYVETKSVCLGL